ncbi:MAG: glutaredoxin family protein [Variovorax sp.]|nr:MAG: glutaredoxin family protein [Variovorax sp.]
MTLFTRPVARAFALPALLLLATSTFAQQVYRNVDPSGKVTFSDQPPAANARPAVTGADAASTSSGAGLPYELRQVAQRYPVTLYTGTECAPCASGRSLLVTRGIPFAERTVQSNADVEALQRLSGQSSLPLLTIGSQQLKGFSDGEWSQYLDAAGYPRSAQLPAGFRSPPAQPMVARQEAAPAAASAAPAARPAAAPTTAAPAGPTPANPAGIRF